MRIAILGLVIAVLLLGCTQPGAPSDTPTGASGQAAPDAGEPATPPAETGAVETDLSGMAYAQLIGLGVPVECDVTTEDPDTGEATTMKMYIHGESFRTEVPTGEATCATLVSIVSSATNKMYVGCEGGDVFAGAFPGCEWLEVDIEQPTDDASTGETAVTSEELGELPSTSFSCRPAVFGAEKFQPDGPSCNLEELVPTEYN